MSDKAIAGLPEASPGRAWRQAAISYGLLPLLLVLACAYFASAQSLFISERNILNVLTQSSYLVMLAAAQMVVLLVRGFDLSMSTVISAISVVIGLLMTAILAGSPDAVALSIALAVLAALAIGMVVGLVNGACVEYLRVNPFIVTLGTQGVAAGFAATLSGGFPIFDLPVELTEIFSRARVAGIPVVVVICAVVLVALHLVLSFTTFGRGICLLGSNPRAAMVAGLPTRRYTIGAYVLCSVLVGLVAVLLTARTGSGEPNLGGTLVLQSIAAAVIGGVSLRGGRGSVYNCLIGGVFITVMTNGMNLLQVDSFQQMIILGALFIAATFLDRLRFWAVRE